MKQQRYTQKIDQNENQKNQSKLEFKNCVNVEMVGFASKSIIELSQYIWWVFKS
jgi:hypothetical protein